MSELQRDSLVGVVCLVPGLGGGGVQEGRSLPVGLQQGEDEETADGLVCVNGGGGGVSCTWYGTAFGEVCWRGEVLLIPVCLYRWGKSLRKDGRVVLGEEGPALCQVWSWSVKGKEFFWDLGWKMEVEGCEQRCGGESFSGWRGACGAGKEGCPGCGGFPGV